MRFCSTAISIVLLAGSAFAQSTFPETRTVEGTTLVLNGTGVREAAFLGFDVYRAGLYLEKPEQTPEGVISSQGKKLLELHFLRNVDVDEIHEDLEEGFDNHGNRERFSHELDMLKSYFKQDVKKGDTITFTFTDELIIERTGASPKELPDSGFSRAVLEIWIGEHAAKPKLKTALLRGADGSTTAQPQDDSRGALEREHE